MPLKSNVPDFAVIVNGAPLTPAAAGDIRAIHVDESIDALSMFTIDLYCWDPATLTVTWPDDPAFAVGNQVTIQLGYVDALTTVMTGEITGLEPSFAEDSPPTLTVRGYDHRHRLARGRKTRGFTATKDSAIASNVAVEAGLRAQVTDSGTVRDLVLQSNQSDLEFLRQRAGLIGYEFFVRDRVLHFHPPADDRPPSVVLDVTDDLSSFTPRLSSMGQSGHAVVRGWDPKTKKPVTARLPATGGGTSSDRAFGLRTDAVVVDAPVATAADADLAARGLRADLGDGYVRGEAELAGRPDLHAGTTVQITGAGKTFSGAYYITGVRHDLELDRGFRTSFDVRRSGV
ncbi:contractile injection system protein, VgrG/Pvc8 family [Dactylosporangium sp. NPDC051485]|uniref:phage late control D family protein n=1 Tax=Dactylosporangium sp. NPDC051485 TaxID=3154846 RepID=UPI003421154C